MVFQLEHSHSSVISNDSRLFSQRGARDRLHTLLHTFTQEVNRIQTVTWYDR